MRRGTKRGKRKSSPVTRLRTVGKYTKAKDKRTKDGASERKLKAKRKSARKRDSSASLRSATQKKARAKASAAGLPPADAVKTHSLLSARSKKKHSASAVECPTKGSAKKAIKEESYKASAAALPFAGEVKEESVEMKSSLEGSCETAAATQSESDKSSALRPSLKASTTSSVGGGADAFDDVKEDSVSSVKPTAARPKCGSLLTLLRRRLEGFVVGGPIDLMEYVRPRMGRRPAAGSRKRKANLRELVPGYLQYLDMESPQFLHYEEIIMRRVTGSDLYDAVDYYTDGSYQKKSEEDFQKIRETIASASHDEDAFEALAANVDSGMLQPHFFLNHGFVEKWSPTFKRFVRDLYLPKFGPLITAVDENGVEYGALELAQMAYHSGAEECVLSQPGFPHERRRRAFQIVCNRAEVSRSLQALDAAETRQLSAANAKIIREKMKHLVSFDSVAYLYAAEEKGFEEEVSKTLCDYFVSDDAHKREYAIGMAPICESTAVFEVMQAVAGEMARELPSKFKEQLENEMEAGDKLDAFKFICAFDDEFIPKAATGKTQTDFVKPCKKKKFLQQIDAFSDDTQSTVQTFGLKTYVGDLQLHAKAVKPHMDHWLKTQLNDKLKVPFTLIFGPPKGSERMRQKALEEAVDVFPLSSGIVDVLRYTLIVEHYAAMRKADNTLRTEILRPHTLKRNGDCSAELLRRKSGFGKCQIDAFTFLAPAAYCDLKYNCAFGCLFASPTGGVFVVGEIIMVTGTMAAMKKPSHGCYEVQRTKDMCAAALYDANHFSIASLYTNEQFNRLFDLGYTPPRENAIQALAKVLTSSTLSWATGQRVLRCFGEKPQQNEALSEVLIGGVVLNKIATHKADCGELKQMLEAFKSDADDAFAEALCRVRKKQIPLFAYLRSADTFDKEIGNLLVPTKNRALLFGFGFGKANVFTFAAKGDATYNRDTRAIVWLHEDVGCGELLQSSAWMSPLVTYLGDGGRNEAVVRALFHKGQCESLLSTDTTNVFHLVATVTHSVAVAKALRALLPERVRELLLKRKDKHKRNAATLCREKIWKRKWKMYPIDQKLVRLLTPK